MIIKSIHTYPIFLALFGWYSTGVCYRQSHNSLAIVKEWDKYAWWLESRGSDGGGTLGMGQGRVCVWFPWTPHEVWCVFDEVNTIDAAESRNHIFPHFMDGRSTHPLIRRQLFASTSQNFKCVPNMWFYSNLDQHTIHTFEYMYTIQLPGNGFPVSRIFGSIFFSSWNIFKDWGKWRLKPLSNRSKLENHIHIGT